VVKDNPRLTLQVTAALVAAAWGAFSASSFVAGAWLGLAGLAGSARTRAKLMAFGGGALAEAMSVELFAHVVHEEHEYPKVAWVLIAASLLGGVLFKCIHGSLHLWLLQRQKKAALARLFESTSSSCTPVEDDFSTVAHRMSDAKAALNSTPLPAIGMASNEDVNREARSLSGHAANSGDACATDMDQVQVVASAAAASAPQVMAVDVPAGAVPGQPVRVTLPNGATIVMKLPDNTVPGDRIDIALPPENGNSTQVQALPKIQSAIRRMLAARRAVRLKSEFRIASDGALAPTLTSTHLNRRGSKLRRDADRGSASEAVVEESRNSEIASALIIWLGSLLDAIPESLVIGILCVDGLAKLDETEDDGSMLAFVAACFVANLPEAMSVSATLTRSGYSTACIFFAWFAIVLVTSLGAGLGALLFGKLELEAEDDSDNMGHYGIATIQGVCGGMMWGMVANTIIPESYELAGGSGTTTTGTWSLMGFAAALAISIAPDFY